MAFFVIFSYGSFILLVGTCAFITYNVFKNGLGLKEDK